MTAKLRCAIGAGCLAATAGLVGVANIELTTRQGVNFKVSTHRIPFYLKALELIDRSVQYRQLTNEIVRGRAADEDRVMAIYDWTDQQIRDTPDGFPVVDDHILNIIIRGYGTFDQRADVFSTLATYAGLPAFWQKVTNQQGRRGLLTFVRVNGRWVVFDVGNRLVFRNRQGRLATLEELAADPGLVSSVAGSLAIGGVPYDRLLRGMRTPTPPRPLRAELQMPWPRLWHETKVTLRIEQDDELQR